MPGNKLVEIYDIPVCSDPRAEGVANASLRDVNKMVKELEAEGVTVKRYVPGESLTPFLSNPEVTKLMLSKGKPSPFALRAGPLNVHVLPITMVNGKLVKSEKYPTIEEVRSALGGNGGGPKA